MIYSSHNFCGKILISYDTEANDPTTFRGRYRHIMCSIHIRVYDLWIDEQDTYRHIA